MQKKRENRRNNKGITLIALVITIIVLLILAGISISTLTGENGILTKATKASDETKKTQIKEYLDLKIVEEQTEDWERTGKEVIVATQKNVQTYKSDLEQWGKDVKVGEVIEKEQEEIFYVTVDKGIYKVGLPRTEFVGYLDFEMKIDKSHVTMKPGETEQLTVTIEPHNQLEEILIWTSSNEEVATVSEGVVTAKNNGTAVIRVAFNDFPCFCECVVEVDSGEFSVFKYAKEKEMTLEDLGFTWTFNSHVTNQFLKIGQMGVQAYNNSGTTSATFTIAYQDLQKLGGKTYDSIRTNFIIGGDAYYNDADAKGEVVVIFKDGTKARNYCYEKGFKPQYTGQSFNKEVVVPFNGKEPQTIKFITSGYDPDSGGTYSYVYNITLIK